MEHIFGIWRARTTLLLCASAWIACFGCGSGHPPTTHVTGTVTYRGKPVDAANVMFQCKTGRPAETTTDSAGHFTLTTFREGDGAVVGDHTVVISKYADDPKATAYDPRATQIPPRLLTPAKYTSPSQSPLHVTVKSGVDNEFAFDLTD
jgi:hypothetical protein